MRAFLRSPLLHFFAIGACLFLVFDVLNDSPPEAPPDTIVLTPQAAQALAERFVATWRRAPTEAEMRATMQAWALEEAAVREALALGLDQGDAAIRQRLSHKLRFVTEAQFSPDPPDDATLQAFADSNPEKFQRPAVISFQQILVDPAWDDAAVAARLEALKGGANWQDSPALLSVPPEMTDISPAIADRTFGTGFGDVLMDAPVGMWSGPVSGGYGRHLVRVLSREPASVPPFGDIRDKVLREWQIVERARLRSEADAALLSRFDIVLPEPAEVLQ